MKTQLKSLFIAAAAAAALGAGISAAEAASIPIFSTGVDSTGAVLPVGSVDPHYTITGFGSAVLPVPHSLYAGVSSTSAWISQAGGFPSFVDRIFVTTFDLTGLDPSTAFITGAWGTDNEGLAVILNGVTTSVAPLLGIVIGNFSSLHAFSIATGFIAGINTLEFVVSDDAAPGAFRAQLSGTADVATTPLPAALPLFASGLGMLGAVTWRRKRRARAIT